MITACLSCGGPMPETINDFYDSCTKKYESFIIAGEQRPPEDQGKYVFWIVAGEPLRPRIERVCPQCGFTYDIYHWVPGGMPP